MLIRALTLGLVLSVATAAQAGYSVEILLPAPPSPAGYDPGSSITAEIQLSATGEAGILARGLQFDTALSDGALDIKNWSWAPAYENGQGLCSVLPSLCGNQHFEDNDLPVVGTVYTGIEADATQQVALPADGSIVLGTVDINLPDAEGLYLMDVINAPAAGDPNNGASISYDFANPTTIDDIVGGATEITVTPEPATLALLGVGGLAALRRRKK